LATAAKRKLARSQWSTDDIIEISQKISNSKLGKSKGSTPDSVKLKISNSLTGVVRSAETRDKISKSSTGIKHPTACGAGNSMHYPGVAEKHKAACLLRSSKKKTCPHCGRQISNNAFERYHNDNCKLKAAS
jgi:hypothetical protein